MSTISGDGSLHGVAKVIAQMEKPERNRLANLSRGRGASELIEAYERNGRQSVSKGN